METTLAQRFEIEKFNRIIDETEDIEDLKKVCKQLLEAWQMQKSATLWFLKQTLPKSQINQNEN
jgi:hypothetical protein